MSGPDDAALVRAAQAGDASCLGTLLDRHRALLHAVAVGMLGHGPQAEDAVHDTFVIALRRIGELRDPGAARAWLLTVLGNVCRSELRRPAVELVADPVEREDASPVEEALERTAVHDWVWAALDRLSPPLRTVTILRHFTGASSYEAISDVCGVPLGTVRSRLNAARAKLAEELLETAAQAHSRDDWRRVGTEAGAALLAFERTGDATPLRSVLAPDLRFRIADRVERTGRANFERVLAADFDDGVTCRPIRMIDGPDVAIVEAWLDSPDDDPYHCPPAVTQVHFHDGHTTRRLVSHYATRADSASPPTPAPSPSPSVK
jgi:RNA polymerase sigma factor (sigma-70 family)